MGKKLLLAVLAFGLMAELSQHLFGGIGLYFFYMQFFISLEAFLVVAFKKLMK